MALSLHARACNLTWRGAIAGSLRGGCLEAKKSKMAGREASRARLRRAEPTWAARSQAELSGRNGPPSQAEPSRSPGHPPHPPHMPYPQPPTLPRHPRRVSPRSLSNLVPVLASRHIYVHVYIYLLYTYVYLSQPKTKHLCTVPYK